MNGGVVDYTASGNLRMLGTRRYAYDAFERLTQVEEASQVRARFTYTSSGERIKSVDLTGPRTVTQYLLADDFDFDATRKLARTHIALGSATVATLTAPYAPTPLVGALPPAAPAPFPAAPVVAGTVLLLALLGLALLLAQRHRRGLPLARPALASGLVLALWIASVPSSAWALPLDGDLNQDGRLDGADALIALEIAQGRRTPSSTEPQSGDVAPLGAAPSTPSAINPADALLILRGAQNEDVDQDGLASQAELTFGSSPFKADTDGDGMADLTEFLNGTNPRDPGGDSDGDGRTDAQEIASGTDPFDRDTDGDGLPDNTDPEPLRGASFLHADQLGSTILTTGANAAVLQRVAYRPYGATVAPSSGPTPAPRFGFTGQRLEAGIGIYDYKARFYDPALGRFLQPDPIVPEAGDPQSLNRYSYVRNNPINRIDPSGNADGLIDFLRENSTRIGGAVQAGFGAVAIAGGAALCTTGVGCVLGGAAIALGADNLATGLQAAITNEETDLLASRGLQAAGVQRDTANAVATVADIAVGGLAGAGKGLVKQGVKEGLESLGDDALRAGVNSADEAAAGAAAAARGAGVVANGARGRASEARVLGELGLPKNTKAVSTAEGRSIPDALTDSISLEVKDAASVSLTRQLRVQTDAARAAGRDSVLVTGERTCVSGRCAEAFDQIIRRSDLGPQ